MTKGTKIALGIGVALTLFGVYWFGVRKRVPKLDVTLLGDGKVADVKFGNNKIEVKPNLAQSHTAGFTYDGNKYRLNVVPEFDTEITKLNIVKLGDTVGDNEIISTQTIDFKSKLLY